MNVNEILVAAQKAGANVGEAYDTITTIAENVEGVVIDDPRGLGKRLHIKDASCELKLKISTNSYVPNKTKYNLVIGQLNRDILLNDALGRPTGQKLEKGLKTLRAV